MASPFSLYKASKIGLKALIIAGLIIVIVILLRQGTVSGYSGASDLVTQPTSSAAKDVQSIFDIRPNLGCTPGPAENASYYTNGLTPGGLCGDGDFVRGQIRDYSIETGIGGSLLEK